jgi:hypothetical protein
MESCFTENVQEEVASLKLTQKRVQIQDMDIKNLA